MQLDEAHAVLLEPGPGRKLERPELLVIFLNFHSPGAPYTGLEGPEPHQHEDHVDSFYVLDGDNEFLLGDRTIRAGPGTFVAAPPQTVHTFTNPGPDGARLLNMHAPDGGFLEFLRSS
jgi:mannose-6-phosphate isomerase-like protein (cupin superfamily)